MGEGTSTPSDAELAAAIMASPVGARALWALAAESLSPGHGPPSRSLVSPLSTTDISRTVDAVAALDGDDLITSLAGNAAFCTPFRGFEDEAVERVSHAEALAPVADVLVARHRALLTRPVVLVGQWRSFEGRRHGTQGVEPESPRPEERWLFEDFTNVYECGEFPVRAWKTIDPVPGDAVEWVLNADDSFLDQNTTMWRFPLAADGPVVHEVVMPEDWMALLAHGARGSRAFRRIDEGGSGLYIEPHPGAGHDERFLQSHAGWDCIVTGIDQDGLATVRSADGQRFTGVRGMAMPDWSAVSQRLDGVHFTWAGILTTEARVVEWRDGWLTTARFWGTPSTIWFRDLFGPAEPLPVPAIGLPEGTRLEQDRASLRRLFGARSLAPGTS